MNARFAGKVAIASNSTAQSSQRADMVKIRVTIDGTALTATLTDNPTAKDFASLLPLTVTLEDYAATEKISYLAFFYKDAPYARGLVPLGRLESGTEAIRKPGPLKATIEVVQQ